MPKTHRNTTHLSSLLTRSPVTQLRAEGDPVRIEDQIVLESIKTPGQVPGQ
jgi:hypothetical protein